MKRYTNHASGHLGWPRGGLVKPNDGVDGSFEVAQTGKLTLLELLLSTTTSNHTEALLRPCNMRGHRGPPGWDKWTQMLPVEWAWRGNQSGGLAGTNRERFFFFCLWLGQLSVRILRFLITADHRGLYARSIVGKLSEGHLSLKESDSSSKALRPFLFLFLSSCHLDRERRREGKGDSRIWLNYLIEVQVSAGRFRKSNEACN